MTDLKKLCKEIESAAREAGQFISKESEVFDINKTESKGHNNFVTYVDKKSERMLIKRLEELIPEAGFIAEEGTSSRRGSRYNWVIDPLDGTTNFMHRVHPYAVSIGLQEENEIIAGVVQEIGGDEAEHGLTERGSGSQKHQIWQNHLSPRAFLTTFSTGWIHTWIF